MKTFDKKDLITWTNRHDVKVGDKGYFAHSIDDLDVNIKNGYVHKLINISNYYACCFAYDSRHGYGFFLPVEAVKEEKPKEKKYRHFKDAYELFKFLFPATPIIRKDFENCMLLNSVITWRKRDTQYFTTTEIITSVETAVIDGCHLTIINGKALEYWFANYEIMNDGKWQPFGVLKK